LTLPSAVGRQGEQKAPDPRSGKPRKENMYLALEHLQQQVSPVARSVGTTSCDAALGDLAQRRFPTRKDLAGRTFGRVRGRRKIGVEVPGSRDVGCKEGYISFMVWARPPIARLACGVSWNCSTAMTAG
jgi:hypothetical protein